MHLSSIFFFVLLALSISDAEETVQVRDALVQFMSNLSPAQRDQISGWNKSSFPCVSNWTGVECSNQTQTVKKIRLEGLNLTGTLDVASLCQARSLMVLSLKSNDIVGALPEEISSCVGLTHVFLQGNKMSSSLPKSLHTLSSLTRFDLSNNDFSGEIPPSVSGLANLLTFDAQNNRLSGQIPAFNFSFLKDFNVSYNNLSGPVPDLGHFNESSVLGNPGLCGKPFFDACPLAPPPSGPSPSTEKKKLSTKDYLMYSGYAAIGLVVLGLVLAKLIKKARKRNIKKSPVDGFKTEIKMISSSSSASKGSRENRSEYSITSGESGRRSSSLVVLSSPVANVLSFEDLMRSPAEMINRGRHGSLYKVTLYDGIALAVKRIKDWNISKDDFKNRMLRIDRVKHVHVMPVVAFYCSAQEKLLVYEYQENGSLFSLLHGMKNSRSSLDWESRIDIAAKVSSALAYMHEHLEADKIVHGNLKSSNILLNQEMEPCISEYGLAESEDQEIESHDDNSTARNRRDPFKADTYGLGIVLLELLTGKLVQNGYELAQWVHTAIREEWTVEVFDRSLVSQGSSEERMVRLLQIALKCVDGSCEARPSIRRVAEMINDLKECEESSVVCEDP